MAWFKKKDKAIGAGARKEIPQGVWVKCEGCSAALFSRELDANQRVCPKCTYHFRLTAWERIALLADVGSFEEIDHAIHAGDPLGFTDSRPYPVRVKESQAKTGLPEVVLTGRAKMDEHQVMLSVMDFGFIGGSMGSAMGEKFTRAAETALAERRPFVSVAASGGARMQEGILSLMQMAKTSAAVGRLHEARVPYISVLTNPTTAGVMASFASLGDVILAEPGALIGFAGPRVIEQTIRQKLPKGFQTSEFVLSHGFVDRIVSRRQLKGTLVQLIDLLTG
ncbi:MAG: acetyl-CoA carboxylase, carboxyltransferase subunit beta [Candidatus Coatesbacteria bacterium]